MIVTLVLLGGTAACGPFSSDEQPTQPHSERHGPVGPVPAGLEKYYGQELSWGPCAGYATTDEDRVAYADDKIECARLTVPMDYADPQSPPIQVGLLRKPATEPSERIGSLLVNPGGPGASGMSAAASLSSTIGSTDLGKKFDLVGFDPRGISSSQPAVHCLSPQERDAARLDADTDTTPGEVQQSEQEERAYGAKCAEGTGARMLANLGTRDVVKDMDVLRSTLGDPKLSYLGYSYGTRIGAEYAKQFPGNVRALLLDGAMDPGQDSTESLVAQGAGFQRAFNDFSRWCAQRDQCALGKDPNAAVAAFQNLARPLLQKPVPAGDRQLSFSDASTAAIQALYAPSLWPQLSSGLTELKQGKGNTLMTLADSYFGRAPSGRYSTVTDAFDAVRCVDDQRVTDPAKARESDRRYREAAPFLDDGQPPSPARDACSFWPVPVTAEPNQPTVNNLPPTLVVSTTGDPATPYAAGEKLAAALKGGLLTYEGTQHTVFLQGNSCVDNAGAEYLINLKLPEPGTRCTS